MTNAGDDASPAHPGPTTPERVVSEPETGGTEPASGSTDDRRTADPKTLPPRAGWRRRPFRFTLKLLAFATVLYYFAFPLLPGFRNAFDELRRVQPVLLVLGFGLEMSALACYSLLMRAALGDAGQRLSYGRVYRIQLSTRALASIVPGGNAASSALGFRLMTLSGVNGADAGFALGTVGLGSAVILNLILWTGLIVSIPIRGVNPLYGTVAVVGIVVMGLVATIVFGLMEGQGRSERIVRWIARKLRLDDDRAARVLHRIAERLDQLISDRTLLKRVASLSALTWLLDASALWVFLKAYNVTMAPDALIIAFGIANVLAAIPITPGGLGYVDTGYLGMLRGFGVPTRSATLGVASYRFAQFFFPILLGGLMYLSLRVGPWSISRHERLERLRELAEEETQRGESQIDFQLRFPTRDDTGELIRRPPSNAIERQQARFRRWRRNRKR